MTTPTKRLIQMTDDQGKTLASSDPQVEPNPGSVVLTEGIHGTAWQRHFADGMWHSSRGGTAKCWADMLRKRNVVLAYDAAERE